ncbi:Uncharacterised protein [[Clostridium] symbiosum]|nr:Uncharacterised protein [[Clostridium] symbiosum]
MEHMADIDNVEDPMYMLTNATGQYGGGSILNELLLERIAELWKEDIILLPSSVHEFLLIPFSKKKNGIKGLAGNGIIHEQYDASGRRCPVEQRISV